MREVTFLITIECDDEESEIKLNKLQSELENVVYKNNYELYHSEWFDE